MMTLIKQLRACHGIQSGDLDCCCAEAADEIERLQAQRADSLAVFDKAAATCVKLRGILQEIWHICHIPTTDTPFRAYTHFQADFDRIRALTKPFVEDAP